MTPLPLEKGRGAAPPIVLEEGLKVLEAALNLPIDQIPHGERVLELLKEAAVAWAKTASAAEIDAARLGLTQNNPVKQNTPRRKKTTPRRLASAA